MLTGQHILKWLGGHHPKDSIFGKIPNVFLAPGSLCDCYSYAHILPKAGTEGVFNSGRAKGPDSV